MFANPHTLPHGQSLYTVAVTACPVGTPEDRLAYDEVDVVAPSSASLSAVLRSAELGAKGYAGCRVVGVLDQTSGTVLAEAWDGDLLTEEAQA